MTRWKSLNLYQADLFPKLSDHGSCLVVHKDFKLYSLGKLDYQKECVTPVDKIEKNDKLTKCGIYIYGGINDMNSVSSDLYKISIDGILLEWRKIKGVGMPPPPLYGHSVTYLKNRKNRKSP